MGARCLLVEPVGGSKFIARDGEFTINIAPVEDGVPLAGCVCAPALKRMERGGEIALAGAAEPGDVFKTGLRCRRFLSDLRQPAAEPR